MKPRDAEAPWACKGCGRVSPTTPDGARVVLFTMRHTGLCRNCQAAVDPRVLDRSIRASEAFDARGRWAPSMKPGRPS